MAATKSIMEKQKIEDNKLSKEVEKLENKIETELNLASEEINELDKAGVKIVNAIKHINNYLKDHAPYYDNQGVILDDIKLGFAEKDDYIDKDKDNIKTY